MSFQTALRYPAVQHRDVGDDYKQVDCDDQNDDDDDIEGDHYEEIDPGDHDEQVDHVDVKGDHDEQVDFDDVKGDHDEQGQHRQLPGRRAAAAPWPGDHQVLLLERVWDSKSFH